MNFIAELLDDVRLVAMREKVDDIEERDLLRRELKGEAERRSLASPFDDEPPKGNMGTSLIFAANSTREQ